MPFDPTYDKPEPDRSDVDDWQGPAVLEFGTSWCGYCQGAQALIEDVLVDAHEVKHVKVADGPGRPLGRSYRVKLWPTLIFLKDGREVARVVRPDSEDEIRDGVAAISTD